MRKEQPSVSLTHTYPLRDSYLSLSFYPSPLGSSLLPLALSLSRSLSLHSSISLSLCLCIPCASSTGDLHPHGRRERMAACTPGPRSGTPPSKRCSP